MIDLPPDARRRASDLTQLLVLSVLAEDDDMTDQTGALILDNPFVTYFALSGLADACSPIVHYLDPAPHGIPVLCWAILQAHANGEHDRARTMAAALVTSGLRGERTAVVDTLSYLAATAVVLMQGVAS